jgi:predicted nucleic acid-binding protein
MRSLGPRDRYLRYDSHQLSDLDREIDVLPELFDRVTLPQAVVNELRHAEAPAPVAAWAQSLPSWIEVKIVPAMDPVFAAASFKLDAGEQEALTLAKQEKADLIILDELRARHVARQQGLKVTGTLGIIEMAAQKGLLDLADALNRLRGTSIYLSEALLQAILQRNALTPNAQPLKPPEAES